MATDGSDAESPQGPTDRAVPGLQVPAAMISLPRFRALETPEASTARTSAPPRSLGEILLVDDDPACRLALARSLSRNGFQVSTAEDGAVALSMLETTKFEAIVSDIDMPGLDGVSLMAAIHARALDTPVVLVTGGPSLQTAMKAVEYGAYRYLGKPFSVPELRRTLEGAVAACRARRKTQRALERLVALDGVTADAHTEEAALQRAIEAVWMAQQPIVSHSRACVFGYESLVRSDEPTLSMPASLIGACERAGRIADLGAAIRSSIAAQIPSAPADVAFFVNLHPRDLFDERLYSPVAPLTEHASRIVLEITERAALHDVADVRSRVSRLRSLGYRIAVDDLGAGYAGLAAFAQLEPDVVKLDMALVRDVDTSATKRKLIGSLVTLCRDLGVALVAEGIETASERDTLLDLGCDLLQGYFFARPGRGFPEPKHLATPNAAE
jgi:EAL domain-containing protein (putative c-di-GMP-specific phosphodiesterase class I)